MNEISFMSFFEAMDDMMFIANQDGNILFVNPALIIKLGYTQEELMKMHVTAINPADKRDEAKQVFSDMMLGKRESSSLPIARKDGTLIPSKTRVWLSKWNSGQCIFGIVKDLSKEQGISKFASSLKSEMYDQSSLANMSEKVSSNRDTLIEQKDRGHSKPRVLIVDDQLFNLKLLESTLKEEFIVMTAANGKEALELATGKDQPDLILLDVIMPEMDGYEVCIKLREMPETKDIPVILITALKNEKNEEYALQLGVVDYITKPFSIPIIKGRVKNHVEQKRYRDRQKENSYIDELTQIANRRKFNECVSIEWHRARRNESFLSVLMVDVDLFKKYNDFFGHLEGDRCLYQIAQTLKANLKRSSDLVARWGGEEFACILTETDQNGAMLVGERLRKAVVKLEIPTKVFEVDNFVTVSIGVATMVPSEDNSLEELLAKADSALYKAKRTGRNCVRSVLN